ncbi:hypothetical protein BHM03_00061359 [Ensete ventricosum]|nr:hypothetical protein BHM03_00061359 [Ensete ventricosum]
MPKVTSGKVPPTCPTAREVGASPAREALKASLKRPVDASVEQVEDAARRHKKVKVLTRRHKSRLGEGESRSRSKGKEPEAPSEEPEIRVGSEERGASSALRRPRSMKDLFKTKVHKDDTGSSLAKLLISYYFVQSQHFQMVLFDRVHDAGRLITFMDYRLKQLQEELDALKYDGGPEAVAKAEERAAKLQEELERTRRERDEALLKCEASKKELHEVRSNLADAQRLLKEARVRARKMDDELLQAVKALESTRAELPKQTIAEYKESLGFKEGLKRMGQVTYEYGYRVALACFHARYPDAEVKEDPFTIHPEDDLVPMQRQ